MPKKYDMTIANQLLSFLIPEEILTDFDIKNIEDREELLLIELVEKEQNISKLGSKETLVSNGFMNSLELQHFPMNGKKCILKLLRRRWKDRSAGSGNYFNTYSYAVKGTKVTPSFGAFLKEFGR